LELLLQTGRPQEIYEWTGPDQSEVLEDPAAYHWLRAQAMAASGNYALAKEECAAVAPSAGLAEQLPTAPGDRQMMALVFGRRVLDECPGIGLPYQLRWPFGRTEFNQTLSKLTQHLRQTANTAVLWGLLALEEGDTDGEEFAFGEALRLWGDETTRASGGVLDFQGRPIAQRCLEWLR